MPKSKFSVDSLLAGTYTVFISAAHSSFSEGFRAQEKLISDVSALGHYFKEVDGVYKGEHEKSLMVSCNDVFDLLQLQALGYKYMQECIMIIDRQANRVLLNYSGDGQTTIIGSELVELAEEVAKTYDSYSLIDGKYWVVI
jgi:hypothetical protein